MPSIIKTGCHFFMSSEAVATTYGICHGFVLSVSLTFFSCSHVSDGISMLPYRISRTDCIFADVYSLVSSFIVIVAILAGCWIKCTVRYLFW